MYSASDKGNNSNVLNPGTTGASWLSCPILLKKWRPRKGQTTKPIHTGKEKKGRRQEEKEQKKKGTKEEKARKNERNKARRKETK